MFEFKEGNGSSAYGECQVVLCPFWSGKTEEIFDHLREVHSVSEKKAHRIAMEFIDFKLENGE